MKNTLKSIHPYGLEIIKESVLYFYAFDEIVAIETEKPYLKLYTLTEKVLFTGTLLTVVENKPSFLCQCSKSLIVNFLHVCELSKPDNSCQLVTPVKTFTVARRRRPLILKAWFEHKMAIRKNDRCTYCKFREMTV